MGEIFGANWKENPRSIEKAIALVDSYANEGLAELVNSDIILFVPYVYMSDLNRHIIQKGYNFGLGSQNVSSHEFGPYSGQISATMMAGYNVFNYMIGHSERKTGYEKRINYGIEITVKKINESGNQIDIISVKTAKQEAMDDINRMLNKKIRAIINYNKNHWENEESPVLPRPLTAFYFVGEMLEERLDGRTLDVLGRQLAIGLAGIPPRDLKEYVTIVYEPRWAIGTGKSANPEDIIKAREIIKSSINDDKGNGYGGSMDGDNAPSIMAIDGINCGIIGNTSLDGKKFARVVKYKDGR